MGEEKGRTNQGLSGPVSAWEGGRVSGRMVVVVGVPPSCTVKNGHYWGCRDGTAHRGLAVLEENPNLNLSIHMAKHSSL